MANNLMEGENSRMMQGQVFAIAMMLTFTIVISWRLMAGKASIVQSFLWLGVCCLCPIAWYIFGYLQATEKLQSNALLANVIGWIFVAMGFLAHYKTLLDVAPGIQTNTVSDPLLPIFLILGLLILVVGGLFSWQAATQLQSLDSTSLE